jgi:hypothetical protein
MSQDVMLITNELKHVLESHRLVCVVEDHWIVVPELELSFQGFVFFNISGSGHLAQLDVRIKSPKIQPRVAMESCSAYAKTRDGLVDKLLSKFMNNSFHVLLSELGTREQAAGQVEFETWQSQSGVWSVGLGRIISTFGTIEKRWFVSYLDQLQELFLKSEFPRTIHWLRSYFMWEGGELQNPEVLLNNETWVAGEKLLCGQPWPAPHEGNLYAIRHFMMITPIEMGEHAH